jgi:hypothetical protein
MVLHGKDQPSARFLFGNMAIPAERNAFQYHRSMCSGATNGYHAQGNRILSNTITPGNAHAPPISTPGAISTQHRHYVVR